MRKKKTEADKSMDKFFNEFIEKQKAVGAIAPGETKNVPIKMLKRSGIEKHMQVGERFIIWEGREIGRGEIIKLPE